jgi:hypothetical protein
LASDLEDAKAPLEIIRQSADEYWEQATKTLWLKAGRTGRA